VRAGVGPFERFYGLPAQKIPAMLNLVTSTEETRTHQSIFGAGKVPVLAPIDAALRRAPHLGERRIAAAPDA
jgi:hypothetical protein